MLSRLGSLLPSFSRNKVDPSSFRANMSTATSGPEIATFAAGCFWGVEHIFLKHYPPAQNKGILKTSVGYTGGHTQNPTYQQVCTKGTGHAEGLRIEFDPAIVSYKELVEFFFRTHDPRTVDQQGNDRGSQYRSAIFAHSADQLAIANAVKADVLSKHLGDYEKYGSGPKAVATQIVDASDAKKVPWYDAEDLHQLYLFNNPSGYQCPSHRLYW
ncbi:methionine sulfoxide reductase A [Athelia psychrophila]|uniref:peptide-methionine (S)-S-oxide reductase n=1 Tax=Athelia psychrophila TaxID=1759441 RepID=A0A166HV48_9AGAM|nr:methionine sulfoxide reductase A [Fibularhizoctonia sp. CBS 109695]